MISKIFEFLQIQKIFDSLQGRSTAFFIAFLISGNLYYWIHGKIDQSFIEFMGVLLAYVIGHSIKDDYFNKKPDGNGN
jgi:hypothetical protein